MSYIKRFFGHLKVVIRHKRLVYHYASLFGYRWRGLVHDLSKFSPVEFFEGVKYWVGYCSPIIIAKQKTGISYAWLHHRGHNKHHPEYWIDKLNDGGVPHKMPFKYVVEMVCDWLAPGKTYNSTNEDIFQKEYDWWKKRAEKSKIHNDTKELVSKILWNLKEYSVLYNGNEEQTIKNVKMFLKNWESVYNEI